MMSKEELSRQADKSFMRIVPQSSNRVVIISRDANVIDVMTVPPPDEKFFITTRSGKIIVIAGDGTPSIKD